MMRDQVPDAFIAALRWEGVSEEQINAALTHIENARLGEDWSSGSKDVRDFAYKAGSRFRALIRR